MSSEGATSFLDTNPGVVQVPASGSWYVFFALILFLARPSVFASRAAAEMLIDCNRDGNDGPWSTFNVYVGTPPQSIKVLVSTYFDSIWVVSANRTQGGCSPAGSPSNCPELRGGLVNVNASRSWSDSGNYALDYLDYSGISPPDFDGMVETADVGYDFLGFGSPNSENVRFESQTVTVYATDKWYLGLLGVMGYNDSSSPTSEGSMLSSLKDSGSTPSLSFAYSAGARYRQATATLTFGGFDSSKFELANGISLLMNQTYNTLPVGLKAIHMNDAANTSLLPNEIQAMVETTTPHIWLPLEACSLFEKAFGIVYNSTVNRYLVNEILHRRLQSENPSVSFILGSVSAGGPTVNLTLPYGSFDLELGPPIVNETQKYFPLRRADNQSQFTLGRTFLQEASLIVDYERGNFSIYQNAWTPNELPQIVTIQGFDSTDPVTKDPSQRTSLIVAPIISVFSICCICIGFMLEYRKVERTWMKSWRKAHGGKESSDLYDRKPEMDAKGKARWELYGNKTQNAIDCIPPPDMPVNQLLELDGVAEISELRGTEGGVEKG